MMLYVRVCILFEWTNDQVVVVVAETIAKVISTITRRVRHVSSSFVVRWVVAAFIVELFLYHFIGSMDLWRSCR